MCARNTGSEAGRADFLRRGPSEPGGWQQEPGKASQGRGRAFPAERTARAKALRQGGSWPARGAGRQPVCPDEVGWGRGTAGLRGAGSGSEVVLQGLSRSQRLLQLHQKKEGPDILDKGMATHSSISPGKSHGQRSLVGYSPWGQKELDTTERLQNKTSQSES